MKTVLAEFKTFALRGNVVDLAIGIIVGAGFNSVVNSLVYDIVMPPIGFVLGKVDFRNLYIPLNEVTSIKYGSFINALISFTITAFVVFLVVKAINRLKHRHEHAAASVPDTKQCPFCISNIPRLATRCPACTSDIAH